MAGTGAETIVKVSVPDLLALTAKLVVESNLKNQSPEDTKKAVCEAVEAALQKGIVGLPLQEVPELVYVVKNVIPHLVDLLAKFNLNALEKEVEKKVVAAATGYWTSCLSYIPVLFRGQVSSVAADAVKKIEAAAPELVKKAEAAAAPLVAEAVKKVEEVAGSKVADVVAEVVAVAEKKAEEVAAVAASVVSPEKVDIAVADVAAAAAAAVPDWSARVDLSGSTVPSNPV